MRNIQILFFCCFLFISCGEKEYKTSRIYKGDYTISTKEEGEIDALSKITITSRIRGKIAWLIPEGTKVKKGDIVIELDKKELEEDIESRMEDLKDAKEHLEDLENSIIDEKKELETSLDKYVTSLEIAKIRLQKLIAGPTTIEKRKNLPEYKRKE